MMPRLGYPAGNHDRAGVLRDANVRRSPDMRCRRKAFPDRRYAPGDAAIPFAMQLRRSHVDRFSQTRKYLVPVPVPVGGR